MATRSGRPFASAPLDGVVRSLYSAGLALIGVGFVAGVLASASVLEATGSVSRTAATTTGALGGPLVGVGAESVVLHLAAVAVAAGVWLVGAGLVVDGLVES
ncbi:hypothetical protein G9C85_07440 [Halorubellus sp. JP-L1]|uniref:hypothetical protein n=1 Tax=Halorubellus sp. JP-L1 TaxID=2715753 RepID=UPI00140CB2C3|nr:hypothetical protein [Halorubellus sp. JP-L1]NHN41471.1 hypothetical protein [Halorubellus sp. JP-L1]